VANGKTAPHEKNPFEVNVTEVARDGEIHFQEGLVMITKTGTADLVLAAPSAGSDRGKVLVIMDGGGYKHTVKAAPGTKINGTKQVAKFGGSAGQACWLIAYNGVWYAASLNGVELS
jgi:hypothetical protein